MLRSFKANKASSNDPKLRRSRGSRKPVKRPKKPTSRGQERIYLPKQTWHKDTSNLCKQWMQRTRSNIFNFWILLWLFVWFNLFDFLCHSIYFCILMSSLEQVHVCDCMWLCQHEGASWVLPRRQGLHNLGCLNLRWQSHDLTVGLNTKLRCTD